MNSTAAPAIDSAVLPKIKYLVIAGIDLPARCFKVILINSDIPVFITKNKELFNRQVVLAEADHDFLRSDSYLDCTQLYDLYINDLIMGLVGDYYQVKASLSGELLKEVMRNVQSAKNIERNVKGIMRQDWSEEDLVPFVESFFEE